MRHLVRASGSCSELQSHALLGHDLGYLPSRPARALVARISALRGQIWACIRHLQRPDDAPPTSSHEPAVP